MARPQGFTNYLEDKILRHVLKIGTYTQPTNLYVGLHIATTLASEAAAAAETISVTHEIVEGAKMILSPGGGQEIVYAGAVSGIGPYSVALVDEAGDTIALSNTHSSGNKVWFDPADDGSNKLEPSAGTYARVLQNSWTNPADNAGSMQSTSDGSTAFAQATDSAWGLATHFFIADAITGGNVLCIGELTNGSSSTPQDVVLNAQLTFPTGTLKINLG